MFMFLHAIALALGLLGGIGGDYGHMGPGFGAGQASDTGSMPGDTGSMPGVVQGPSQASDTGSMPG